MGRTIGYHIVVSGYGLWLPGDPVRHRMAQERLKHPPVKFSREMQDCVTKTIESCRAASDWKVAAASIEATHTHILLTYTERDIDNTVKWLKDQITKSIHRETSHDGPVWCKGSWRSYIFDEAMWESSRRYIERHNERRGVGPRPYTFLT